MRVDSIHLLILGAGLAAANPLSVMISTTEVSAIRLGHAAASPLPEVSSDASPTRMRHICKNMQKGIQDTASRLFAAIGLSGPSVSVTAPVTEGGVTRVQITHHRLVPTVVEPYTAGGGSVMRHGMHKGHEEHKLHGSLLNRVHRALMSLGPWEGRVVAFVLGCGIGVLLRMLWVLAVLSVRAFRSNPEPETIFVYAEDSPSYEFVDEKKLLTSGEAEVRA
ncbi:hypothetical protein BC834DRAFT_871663 [Gloeopeniophorella convolvens]|nr:hypothetical protein BC834DRAFT_871663 [Gloeopeniophorella convolvens]